MLLRIPFWMTIENRRADIHDHDPAFILFRQHNHASVVQANPGKPNPEISKIIGEMWRESSKETKAIWQRHADVGRLDLPIIQKLSNINAA